ncbi:MAG: hypothetical protein WB586_11995 [Chthoniobacterales bacterium]
MNRSKQCWVLLGICLGVVNGNATDFTFTNTPGKDAVGFRVVLQYDFPQLPTQG